MTQPSGKSVQTTPFRLKMWRTRSSLLGICGMHRSLHPRRSRCPPPLPLPPQRARGGPASTTGSTGSSSTRRPSATKRCYNCQTYGHIAANCPYAQVTAPNLTPRFPTGPQATQAPPVPAVGMAPANIAPQPFRAPQRNQVRHQQSTGYCFEWNNTGQCQQPGCRRDHRCSHCSHLHPRRECQQYPPNQQG